MEKFKVGYTTGVYDMFHIGHLNILKHAKEVDYDWVVKHNQQLCMPTTIHPKTAVFFQMLDEGKSFKNAVAVATHKSIITRAIGKIRNIHRQRKI